jgi:hypothetical protein
MAILNRRAKKKKHDDDDDNEDNIKENQVCFILNIFIFIFIISIE